MGVPIAQEESMGLEDKRGRKRSGPQIQSVQQGNRASVVSLCRRVPRGNADSVMTLGQDAVTLKSSMPPFGKADGFLVYIMQNNWSR